MQTETITTDMEETEGLAPGARASDEFSLERTGDRPLIFTGARIGFGTTKSHQSLEWTDVTIYKTAGGSYVADVDRFAVPPAGEFCQAYTYATPEALVGALQDSEGKLDRAAVAACQEAARNDAQFLKGWVERVE